MTAPIFPKPWLGIQKSAGGTSLVVQLRMPHYQCRDLGNAVLIRGWGTKIPHSVWPKKKINKKNKIIEKKIQKSAAVEDRKGVHDWLQLQFVTCLFSLDPYSCQDKNPRRE